MRKGFFASPKAEKPAERDVAELIHSETPESITEATDELTIDENAEISLPSDEDRTVVHQEENSFILQSDYRFDSPYFAYLPPSAEPGEAELVFIDDDVDVAEASADWPVWKQPRQDDSSPKSFTISAIPGKGLGMIATRDIRKGELICSERPFYVSSKSKLIAPDQGMNTGYFQRAAASRLGRKQRAQLLALSNHYPADQLDEIPGKLNTNFLPADVTCPPPADRDQYCAAFATLSRANHSCAPNTNYFFHFPDYTGRFYAMRNVNQGEEITIMYVDPSKPFAARQVALQQGYRFTCSCEICSLPSQSIADSDRRRADIQSMLDKLYRGILVDLEEMKLGLKVAASEQIYLYRTHILHFGGTALLEQGSQVRQDREMAELGMKWLRLAKMEYTNMEGVDSYHVKQLAGIAGV